jgi:hypothetical protein
MADLSISQLPVLTGALLQATDPIAVADLSASETKKITAKEFVQGAVALIDDLSIPGAKVNVTIPDNSVGTTKLINASVTELKLANGSSGRISATATSTAGAYIGQLAVLTPNNVPYIWNGSAWVQFQTGVLTLTGGTSGAVVTTVTNVGSAYNVVASIQNATGPREFLAGPASSSGAFSRRQITSADLPLATSSVAGVSSVPAGEGIRIDSGLSGLEARLEIDNDVTQSVVPQVVTYNAKGLITGGRAISSADLPIATAGSIGAVAGGTEFVVNAGTGVLRHTNQVVAGTGIKVTYDAQGHIVSATGLLAADIPALDTTKITTGTFDPGRIADRSIVGLKLANNATTIIQDEVPTGTNYFVGQFWYREADFELRVWSGNSWVSVGLGAGRVTGENLRFSGTFNATTGTILQVTQFGAAAGLNAGNPIPAASDSLIGVYLVCTNAGTYLGKTYDQGDWILCLGATEGYDRVDTLNSGATTRLEDLLDTSIAGVLADDLLQYDGFSWVNVDVISGGTY